MNAQDQETAIHNGGIVISKGKNIYEYYCNECFLMKFDQWACLEWPLGMPIA